MDDSGDVAAADVCALCDARTSASRECPTDSGFFPLLVLALALPWPASVAAGFKDTLRGGFAKRFASGGAVPAFLGRVGVDNAGLNLKTCVTLHKPFHTVSTMVDN